MSLPERMALLLAAIGVLYGAQARAAECPGSTTPEVQECQKADGQRIETELNRYVKAAEGRIRESDDPKHALADFRLAQEHWKQYRDAECRAVFEGWSTGTIRGSMELDCRQKLTESRIVDIWRVWLTYSDNTPPTLPKPKFSD